MDKGQCSEDWGSIGLQLSETQIGSHAQSVLPTLPSSQSKKGSGPKSIWLIMMFFSYALINRSAASRRRTPAGLEALHPRAYLGAHDQDLLPNDVYFVTHTRGSIMQHALAEKSSPSHLSRLNHSFLPSSHHRCHFFLLSSHHRCHSFLLSASTPSYYITHPQNNAISHDRRFRRPADASVSVSLNEQGSRYPSAKRQDRDTFRSLARYPIWVQQCRIYPGRTESGAVLER